MIQTPEEEQFAFGPWVVGLVNAVGARDVPPGGLTIADDINLDRAGVATTRRLWDLQDAAPYASVFQHRGVTYAVRTGATREVGIVGDSSFTALASVNGPLSWTLLHDAPVYTDGENIQVLVSGAPTDLPAGHFEGDEDEEFQLVPLPGGSHIHYWQGRLLVARGTTLMWSDALRYGVYSAARNFVRFGEQIGWVAPLPTGVFVGTTNHVYFLSGSDPAKFTRQIVGGRSAPGASAVYLQRHTDADKEEVALWFTSDGVAVGRQTGNVEYPQLGNLKDMPLYPGKMVVENDRVTIFTTKEQ